MGVGQEQVVICEVHLVVEEDGLVNYFLVCGRRCSGGEWWREKIVRKVGIVVGHYRWEHNVFERVSVFLGSWRTF